MPLLYWQDDETGETESVELDATQSETHEDTLTITDHAVEEGANVADHAREEPTRLSIEGVVSSLPNPRIDTDAGFQTIELTAPARTAPGTQTIKLEPPKPPLALTPSGLIQAGVVAVGNAVFGGPDMNATFAGESRPTTNKLQAQVYQQTAPRNRIRDVYDLLLKAQTRRLLVTVQTKYREHFDMLLERVAMPRTLEDGSSAKFQVDLRRIRVADSETVQAPQPTEARGAVAKSKGSQNGKPDPNAPAKEEKRQTILRQMGVSVADLLGGAG
jgi:hypothetical protein